MLAVVLVALLPDKLDEVGDDDRSWRIQKRGRRRPDISNWVPGRGQTRKEKRVHSAATAIPEPPGAMAPVGNREFGNN